MRLVHFGPEEGREIDRFGSVGFVHTRLAASSGEAALSVVRLAPGGRIGGHPAVSTQILAVVSGSAVVSGAGDEERSVDAGTAVVWEAGEVHETRTTGGLVAFVLEGAGVHVPAGP